MDRKEIKRKYKQTSPPMGVYQIRNQVNGKIYIGSSKNLTGIFNRYKFQLKNGSHMNSELQKEFSQFGEESFCFEVLDNLKIQDDPLYNYDDDLKTLEELWLEKLQPYDEKGYNQKRKSKE
jgi:group I intron endonuclease